MRIIFVTDYVCPYCMIGKASLKEAIKRLKIDVTLETLPMQLTKEPAAKVDTWNNAKKREGYKILDQAREELKIDAKFPPFVVPRPYTRLAFEGHFFAEDHGISELYDDAMYRAYFVDEKDIGELEVLLEIAESLGLSKEEYLAALEEGRYREKVEEADAYTKKVLGVTSVPTMFIEGERVQFEDYTIEDAIRILKSYM